MSRSFTVIGFWDDSDQPVPVAVVELIGGGQMLIGGGEGCSEGGPWATDLEAIDMDSAEGLAVEEMLATLNQGEYDEENTCDTEECTNALDDGEGWDGKCGDCADRIEAESHTCDEDGRGVDRCAACLGKV